MPAGNPLGYLMGGAMGGPLLQQGVGGGGQLPPVLTTPMGPSPTPQGAMMGGMGQAMQDPRIAAYIRALMGGAVGGTGVGLPAILGR